MPKQLLRAAAFLLLTLVVGLSVVPTVARAQQRIRVGFVPPALTSPFHVAVVDGAKARAAELGWDLDVRAPSSEGDFQAFVSTVQELLDTNVDALATNTIGTESGIAAIKAANARNIPFVAYNFITPFPDDTVNVSAYIGYDQWGGAEKLGRYTCELLAEKYGTTPEEATGKVFILTGIESLFSRRRTLGYKAGLETCPKVRIVGEQAADWLRDRGEEVANAALLKFPDIDLFYANSDEMAIGAGIAAEKLGLVVNQDIYTIAIDGNLPTLDLIGEGTFTATLGVYPFKMGEATIDIIANILDGAAVPQYTLTPSTIVNADNLEAYIAGDTWTDPLAGAPEFDNTEPTVPEATPEATPSS